MYLLIHIRDFFWGNSIHNTITFIMNNNYFPHGYKDIVNHITIKW